MRRMAGYPKGFYGVLLVVFVSVAISGILLIPNMLLMKMDIDVDWQWAGDKRLVTAAFHCTTAFLVTALFGALLAIHGRTGWHRKQNRKTGLLLPTLLLVQIGSAVGLYYFGDEDLSLWSSVLHAISGSVLMALMILHGILGHAIHNHRRHIITAKSQAKKNASV